MTANYGGKKGPIGTFTAVDTVSFGNTRAAADMHSSFHYKESVIPEA